MRIRVIDVVDMLNAGASEAEILADFPDLEPEDIAASVEYATDDFIARNRDALNASIRRGREQLAQGDFRTVTVDDIIAEGRKRHGVD